LAQGGFPVLLRIGGPGHFLSLVAAPHCGRSQWPLRICYWQLAGPAWSAHTPPRNRRTPLSAHATRRSTPMRFASKERAMRPTHWLMTAMLGLLLTGCAGIGTAPTTEARQALAPTGKLRVGLQLGSPHNVIRDSASGEMKGVGFDLGKELARRMGVPFEPVLYPSVGALLDSEKSGAWDVAFVGFSPARAQEWDFTALHMEVEFGYLIPGGSSISTMADVDRSGIRVAVQEKSQPDIFLSRTLKNAEG
jgi:hypothetical protein